jgi:hypothetical protein
MVGKHIITEVDFAEYARCPIRAEQSYDEGAELEVAKETAKWLLGLVFQEALPPLCDIRAYYESCWKAAQRSKGVVTGIYKRGLLELPHRAKRLSDLAMTYLVLRPSTVYNQAFGRNSARGEYSVLVRSGHRSEPLILRLRLGCDRGTEIQHRGPDIINMLRWLNFRTWTAELPLVRVLNYSLDKDESWMDYFNERAVQKYLNSIASNIAEKRLYPAPGPHCETCKIPSCVMDAVENYRSDVK